jgi:hypothetical protein
MSDGTLNEQPVLEDRGVGSGPTTRNPGSVQAAASCPAFTRAGQPCRMRPTAATGRCMAHSDLEANRARGGRGGTLKAAHAALAAQKAALIEKYGLQAELPTLDSVEALGAYLASVAARIEAGKLTPAQGNTLTAIVKQSAALLGLSLDIRLAEQLDSLEGR